MGNRKTRLAAWGLSLALVTGVLLQGAPVAAADLQKEVVSYNGKAFTVQWTAVDVTDPHIRVRPVVAEQGVGHVESMASMVERAGAVAAINGTFFDAYEEDESLRHPNGLMLDSGRIVRSGENQTLAVSTNKVAVINRLQAKLSVLSEDGQTLISPWGVNTYYGNSEGQVVAYTDQYPGPIAFAGGAKITISGGAISAITEDAASVPENGYVIFVGHTDGNDKWLLPKLKVGMKVKVEALFTNSDSGMVTPAESWVSAIGVGPKLLSGGAVDIDFARDGFDDPRITSSSNVRSFTGIDGSGRLVMGVITSATMEQMAHVLAQIGLVEAMNMDGGASSGFYADGRFVQSPGRLLSNALVITRDDRPQVQVEVNGQLVTELRGFIDGGSSITMVPLRGILERLGAELVWDDADRRLDISKGSTKITLRPDVREAVVNGKTVTLGGAPVIENQHLFIPLRFVAETLQADVDWNPDLYRASLVSR
ncbi:phosphodiester glycosidase family protein [Paenibacillus sp. y28]|uniref:phosphodiester glycosidase family protein n=1 Tax=Paenibacillus sp. y28 TaxID=3129110 RepID=UPI003017013D